ncbi:hypothetical protein HY061_02540 [Candidatus Azambacteria bacterium]|nr:hypothetical protein [Candidatus Azambacteria bacterium]
MSDQLPELPENMGQPGQLPSLEEGVDELTSKRLSELSTLFDGWKENNTMPSEEDLQKMADNLQEKNLVYEKIFSQIIDSIEDKDYLRSVLDKFSDFDPEKLENLNKTNKKNLETSHYVDRRLILLDLRTAHKNDLLPEGKAFGDYAPPEKPFDSLSCQILKKLDEGDKIKTLFNLAYRPQTRLFALSLLKEAIYYPANLRRDNTIINLFLNGNRRRDDVLENNLRKEIIEKGLLDKIPFILTEIIKSSKNINIKEYAENYFRKKFPELQLKYEKSKEQIEDGTV